MDSCSHGWFFQELNQSISEIIWTYLPFWSLLRPPYGNTMPLHNWVPNGHGAHATLPQVGLQLPGTVHWNNANMTHHWSSTKNDEIPKYGVLWGLHGFTNFNHTTFRRNKAEESRKSFTSSTDFTHHLDDLVRRIRITTLNNGKALWP